MATFCSKCGKELNGEPAVCPHCGEKLIWQSTPPTPPTPAPAPVIVNIENTNTNTNANVNPGMMKEEKNKWVALLLWFFLGLVGGHKFYEGKIGMGVLYIFTFGLLGIGLFVDFWVLIFKPTHYYV